MFLCMYVCMYYVCMHICFYVLYMYVCEYMCDSMSIYALLSIRVCVYMLYNTYIHICFFIYNYVRKLIDN